MSDETERLRERGERSTRENICISSKCLAFLYFCINPGLQGGGTRKKKVTATFTIRRFLFHLMITTETGGEEGGFTEVGGFWVVFLACF